jgi:4a-hydroxytetrahydrobiopterin dehydratase
VLGGCLLAEEGKGVKSQGARRFADAKNVHCKRSLGCYSFPVMAELIKADQLKIRLKKIPEWELEKKHIERTFEFDDFSESIDFVNSVAEVSEDEEHHPDIDIRYNKVRLVLSTHSKGGLTDLDFALAERIDTLSE